MDVEARVAEAHARGDHEGAATAAIEGFGPAIHGYLCSMLDPDDAADVFGGWAETLWRSMPAFRRECSARSWAYRLAWSAFSRFRRDPWVRRGVTLPTTAASRLAASVTSGLEPGSRRDRLRILRAGLSEEDQTLLVLRIDKELAWEEIATVLSVDGGPPQQATALRKRFERLKERLAERAREQGLLD